MVVEGDLRRSGTGVRLNLRESTESCEQHLWEFKEEVKSQVKAASPAEVVSVLVVKSIRREVRLKKGSGKLGS